MLCYEVTGAGVERTGEKGGEDKVDEGAGAEGLQEEVVKCALGEDVEEVEGGEGQLVDADGAEGVEEDLEGAEEGFAED